MSQIPSGPDTARHPTARRPSRRSRRRTLVIGSVVACLATLALILALTRPWASGPTPTSPSPRATPVRCVTAASSATATDSADDPATTTATATATASGSATGTAPGSGLTDPATLEIARELISSAENSTLDWQAQYGYLEYDVEGNEEENRGYTGGIVGFTSKTHDMLQLVERYAAASPQSPLAGYVEALRAVDGTSSRAGLGDGFVAAWQTAATDPAFGQAQRELADELYVRPGVEAARADGLGALGQFVYVDALVMHGPGEGPTSFGGIRSEVLGSTSPPARGGDETAYLLAFLDRRAWAMEQEQGHEDTSRVAAQRSFVEAGNLTLTPPLTWTVYGDRYSILPPGQSCP